MRSWREPLILALAAAAALVGYGAFAEHGPALADEFIYLASARHFAETGSLDARYYDGDALLEVGYPHHDVHTPGYVIALGALIGLVSGSYSTAVGLNVAAYLITALCVWQLGLALGFERRRAWLGGLAAIALPALLPYVYWALAELLLTALFAAGLAVAAHSGRRAPYAVGAGLLLGLAILVRESALLGTPAVASLFEDRKTAIVFVLVVATFLALVYVPLAQDRAPGGANFWQPTSGTAFGYRAVQAFNAGRIARALELGFERAAANLTDLARPRTTWTERGILASYVLLPAWALVGWGDLSRRQRRYLVALTLGWTAVAALLVFVYIVGDWSGLRYIMFLMPGFLPFLASPGRGLRFAAPLLLVAGIVSSGCAAPVLNGFKARRQERQGRISAYLDRYVDPRSVRRVVLSRGWDYGLRHYPTEVISSLPRAGGGGLRALERVLSFDVLVLPGDSPLREELDGRARYRRLNGGEHDPPLLVYRRLR